MVVGYIWRIKSAERTMRWLEDVWRESSLTIHKLQFVGMITKLKKEMKDAMVVSGWTVKRRATRKRLPWLWLDSSYTRPKPFVFHCFFLCVWSLFFFL